MITLFAVVKCLLQCLKIVRGKLQSITVDLKAMPQGYVKNKKNKQTNTSMPEIHIHL